MQSPTQAQPAVAPAPPPAQAPPAPVTITTVGPEGTTQTLQIPKTAAEVGELLAHRNELTDQLSNVTARRSSLSEQIISAPSGASRTGLEDRVRLLDRRILQIEGELDATGRQLASAPVGLMEETRAEGRGGGGDDFEEGLMAGGFSVLLLLLPIVLFFARRRWKKPRAATPAQLTGESDGRLERLERGMEAIAIEIERVSEGQRFVTRLLSESQTPLGALHRIPQSAQARSEDPAKA